MYSSSNSLFSSCYLKKRGINLPGQLIAQGHTEEQLSDYIKDQQLLLHPDLICSIAK